MSEENNPEKKQLIARIPAELHSSLKVIAVIKDITMNDVVIEAVQEWVNLHQHDAEVQQTIQSLTIES